MNTIVSVFTPPIAVGERAAHRAHQRPGEHAAGGGNSPP
jgi:hypothetical protein